MNSDSPLRCSVSNYNWSSNSLGQDPCTVSEYLNLACSGNDSSLIQLTSNSIPIPERSDQNQCLCTSVVYSLIFVCRLCRQEDSNATWSQWISNCNSPSLGFPVNTIPDTTTIPQWANQSLSESGQFNLSLAASVASSAANQAESPDSTSTATHSSITDPSSLEPTVASQVHTSRTDVGAIVGGVVGGIVFVAVAIAMIFFYLRCRRDRRLAPSTVYLAAQRGQRRAVSEYRESQYSASFRMDHAEKIPSTLSYEIDSPIHADSGQSFDPYKLHAYSPSSDSHSQ